jgi:uncharacterized membrane protein YoaK (UPF0700 family)
MGPPSLSSSRHELLLAGVLALIAGYVDAYGLISYRTYLSFMSGNTTQTGSQVGQGHLDAAVPSFIAIVFFVIGVFTGALLTDSGLRQGQRRAFALVAILLAAVLAITQVATLANGVAIAALSLAMGTMNATTTHVGAQSLNNGFVTGTLNTMARHLAQAVMHAPLLGAQGPWDTHLSRSRLMFGVWSAFIGGAFLAGMATPRYGVWILLPPLLILAGLAMLFPDRSRAAAGPAVRPVCGR